VPVYHPEFLNGIPTERRSACTPRANLLLAAKGARVAGSEWFLGLLDETPEVCASGSTGNPMVAFAQESLIPPHFEAVQNRAEFPQLSFYPGRRCRPFQISEPDPYLTFFA
jgi:hypothetical protein